MLLLDPNNNYASDSEESLLPDEGDSFTDEQASVDPEIESSPSQQKAGLQVSELMKQKAKEQALKRLNRPIDKKLGELGSRMGISSEAMSGLGTDTEQNRERLKEEARESAKKYSKQVGERVEQRIGKGGIQLGERGAQVGRSAGLAGEARTAATAAKGAKTAATAAKGAKAVGTGVKGVQGAIAVAGAVSGPETLGLGTLAALLLNIAISLGISDAIDCLFELKAGNMKQALFHATKAIFLIQGFIWLLVALLLNITVVGIIIGGPLVLFMTIYAVLGMFFPGVPHLQGLSRNWMLATLFLMDLFVLVMIVLIFAGVLFGICTNPTIGSLIGWGGYIGDAINYVGTNFGSGGYLSALNQACTAIKP